MANGDGHGMQATLSSVSDDAVSQVVARAVASLIHSDYVLGSSIERDWARRTEEGMLTGVAMGREGGERLGGEGMDCCSHVRGVSAL